MNRRTALEWISWLMGGAISSSTIAGVLSGCRANPNDQRFAPRTLTSDQLESVAVLAEHIIPTTDTPGAREAGVHTFIDNMLTDFFQESETQGFTDGLDEVSAKVRTRYGKELLACSAAEQVALLRALEAESHPFYKDLRFLTVTGYYTSEVGATRELHLAPYGAYHGDIPFEDIGRTWA